MPLVNEANCGKGVARYTSTNEKHVDWMDQQDTDKFSKVRGG